MHYYHNTKSDEHWALGARQKELDESEDWKYEGDDINKYGVPEEDADGEKIERPEGEQVDE